MRLARFSADGEVRYGVVIPAQGAGDGPQEGDHVVELAELAGHPFGVAERSLRYTGRRFGLAETRLLAPVLPTKVVAIGKNYADHVAEMGGSEPPSEPVLFLKPSTSVIGPSDPIVRPVRLSERIDYEGELAVIIGRLCREVSRDRAHDVIFGYTCANDVTARDLQARDGQWARAKGFDTFCPLGPWIETDCDPSDLEITTMLNGLRVQHARTSELVHGVDALIEHVTAAMTLVPGDVLLTGTPAGVGQMKAGDEVSVTVEGIGTLTNPVVDG